MAWKGMYKVIGEVNAFVANVEGSPLDGAIKTKMEAEARFLRALAYYNLAVVYGDVPLKTTPSAHDALEIPRSPRATVYEQARTDWEFAYENLPETSDDGFANKYAAKAYLGKLYYTLACQEMKEHGHKQKLVLMRYMANMHWNRSLAIYLPTMCKAQKRLSFSSILLWLGQYT